MVKDAESLYSICKRYNAQEEAVISENPGVKKTLKPGQNILIPVDAANYSKSNSIIVDPKIVSVSQPTKPNSNYDSIFIHRVEKGQTLYFISRKYDIPIDEIKQLNPEAADGLKVDMDLKIPAKKVKTLVDVSLKEHDATNHAFSEDDAFVKHTVKKNETLYSIAKDYNTTKEQLLFNNPESAYGLKEGQEIRVPKKKKVTEKTEQKSLQGDNSEKVDFSKSDTLKSDCNKVANKEYTVSVLMPFYIKDVGEIQLSESEEKIDPENFKSFTFIGFYEGMQIALDSLKQTGSKLNVHFYDSYDDSTSLKNILAKPELVKSNLIIGPFFTSSVKTAAKYAKSNHIHLVSPFAMDSKVLENNPYVLKATPSNETQLSVLAHFIVDSCEKANVILAYNEKSLSMINLFKQIKDLSIVNYTKDGAAGIIKNLKANRKNVIVVLIDNQVVVTTMLSALANKTSEFQMSLFGLPEWSSYNSLELDILNKLNYHFYSIYHIDYKAVETLKFVNEYKNRFNSQPDRFAFAGYDLMMYFAQALKKYGENNTGCLSKIEYKPLQTQYHFSNNGKDGFENKYVHILKIEDCNIKKVR